MENYNLQTSIDVCKKAWETFGKLSQMRQTQEECAELIVAINHHLRCRDKHLDETSEEMADVLITLLQIMSGLDLFVKVDKQINKKLHKLESKLNDTWPSTK